jgi:hypothetical protein
VGFGTGMGVSILAEILGSSFLSENKIEINFISLEEDENLIKFYFYKHSINYHKNTDNIFEATINPSNNVKINLKIICGDARKMTKKFIPYHFAHAIFQDAFSIKKNPSLWTVEWFEDLYDLSRDECIMSTYCASAVARRSMLLARWNWKTSAGFGVKKSSTIATKNLDSNFQVKPLEEIAIKNNGFILRDKAIAEFISQK